MSFTVIALAGDKFLVEGTDGKGTHGSTVVHSPTWADVLKVRKYEKATEEYDVKVREFFAPLTEAFEELDDEDRRHFDMSHVVFDEGSEGTERRIVHLDPAGIVLKLIEDGGNDQLIWVHDELYVMA